MGLWDIFSYAATYHGGTKRAAVISAYVQVVPYNYGVVV